MIESTEKLRSLTLGKENLRKLLDFLTQEYQSSAIPNSSYHTATLRATLYLGLQNVHINWDKDELPLELFLSTLEDNIDKVKRISIDYSSSDLFVKFDSGGWWSAKPIELFVGASTNRGFLDVRDRIKKQLKWKMSKNYWPSSWWALTLIGALFASVYVLQFPFNDHDHAAILGLIFWLGLVFIEALLFFAEWGFKKLYPRFVITSGESRSGRLIEKDWIAFILPVFIGPILLYFLLPLLSKK